MNKHGQGYPSGRTGAEFVTANDDINAYLKRQPGFRWRRITQHGDGTNADGGLAAGACAAARSKKIAQDESAPSTLARDASGRHRENAEQRRSGAPQRPA